jgi:Caspase domain
MPRIVASLALLVALIGFVSSGYAFWDDDLWANCRQARGANPDEAIRSCTLLIEQQASLSGQNPKGWMSEFHRQRGWAYSNKGDYGAAVADLTSAIKYLPSRYYLYCDRAAEYNLNGEYSRAISDATKGIELRRKESSAADERCFLQRGIAKLRTGKQGESARLDIKKALEIRPNYKGALGALAELETAEGKTAKPVVAPAPDFAAPTGSPAVATSAGLPANGKRVALVIGNSTYSSIGKLDNPNDARPAGSPVVVSERASSRPLPLNYRDAPVYNSSPTERPAWLRPEPPAVATSITPQESQPVASPPAPTQQAAAEPAKPVVEAAPELAAPAASATSPAVTASLGKRVALVIGNSAYQHTTPLPNPANDASDVAAALKRLGFTVIEEENLDKRGMDDAFRRFAREMADADAAMFFYAGHAMQWQGANYLMPVDAKLEDEADVPYEMAKLNDMIADMGRVKAVRIAVLDACRDNPLEDRLKRSIALTRGGSQTRGLARIEKADGLVVAYSTNAGNVAEDGQGRNSPFTKALLDYIETPGLEVGVLFRRVMGSVKQATGGKQHPELSILLDSEFYFKPGT